MALTTCKECGKEVSTAADACPHCGAPRKRLKPGPSPWTIIGWVIVGFICLLMYGCYQAFKPKVDANGEVQAASVSDPAPAALSAHIVSTDCAERQGRTRATVIVENTGPEIRHGQMFITYVGDHSETAYGDPSTIPPGARSSFSFVRSNGATTGCQVDRLQDGSGNQVSLN